MRRKIFTLVLAASLITSSFGVVGNVAAADEGKVELNYYSWHDEDAYLEPIVEAFNAQSETTHVNYYSLPAINDEYYDKILVMLAGKEDIDLIGINGAPWYASYTNSGVLLGLNDLIEANNVDLSPYGTLFTQYAIDGEYYALPHRRTLYALAYNVDMFKEKGLDAPENLTWTEFVELAKELTDEENGIYGFYPAYARWSWMLGAVQAGETILDDELPKLREALEVLNQFYNVDHSALSFAESLTLDSPGMRSLFSQGKCAMMSFQDTTITLIRSNLEAGDPLNYDITTLPVPEGVEFGTTMGQGTFTGITSYCEHPENAFEFLTYLCGEEGAIEIAKAGTLPCYTSDKITSIYKESCPEVPSVAKMFEWKSNIELPVHPKIADVRSLMQEEVHMYLLGEQTIDECMDHIYSRRSEVLGE